ncbi:hypothetical protein BH23CHL7_BH23CHL7_05020 [soil metagenome]
MRKILRGVVLSVAALSLVATGAMAAVTFDPADGTGFVGKGDVQLALGYNNKQLQNNANDLQFAVESQTETEASWTCDRDAGPQTNERNNTITTTTQGLLEHVERDNKKQITGFRLTGYDGNPEIDEERDGPATGACPTGWTATDLVVGDPVELGSGLTVNGVALE